MSTFGEIFSLEKFWVKMVLAWVLVLGGVSGWLMVSVYFSEDEEDVSRYWVPINEISASLTPELPPVVEAKKSIPEPVRKPKPKPKPKPARRAPKKAPPVKAVVVAPKPIKNLGSLNKENPLVIAFNRQALAFGEVMHVENGRVQETVYENQNLAEGWTPFSDKNAYPYSLDRVLIREKIIPGILANRIISTYSGRVLIMVSSNIYASSGNRILIPIGSKASGIYRPLQRAGEDRLSFVVERIVKPDGDLILFETPAGGTDSQGAAGITGEVDNHYFEKFGMPLLFSVLQGLSNATLRGAVKKIEDNNGTDLSENIFTEQWYRDQSETNKQVTLEILRSVLSITPVITIEPGTRINFMLARDVVFGENRNGTIMAQQKIEEQE